MCFHPARNHEECSLRTARGMRDITPPTRCRTSSSQPSRSRNLPSPAADTAATTSPSSSRNTATPSSPSCGISSPTARRRDRSASTTDARCAMAKTPARSTPGTLRERSASIWRRTPRRHPRRLGFFRPASARVFVPKAQARPGNRVQSGRAPRVASNSQARNDSLTISACWRQHRGNQKVVEPTQSRIYL